MNECLERADPATIRDAIDRGGTVDYSIIGISSLIRPYLPFIASRDYARNLALSVLYATRKMNTKHVGVIIARIVWSMRGIESIVQKDEKKRKIHILKGR